MRRKLLSITVCMLLVLGALISVDIGLEVIIISQANSPPVADAGPDQTVNVWETVQFDGSNSYDPESNITFEWDFGDGSPFNIDMNPTHIYQAIGTYNVTLVVTDWDDNTDSDFCIITIIDQGNPIADAGPDQTAYIGETVHFNGSGSFDPDVHWENEIVDWGEGGVGRQNSLALDTNG
ncbi:MAG: PKD domain-containing protein, partial [Thermoplasmata archaeon]